MYGLIGKDVSHSFSKIIQESLMNKYTYHLLSVDEHELDEMFSNKNFDGLNVTIPYKQTVIKYLDFIDTNARRINAVNTIVKRNGFIYGYNTDYDGFMYTIINNDIDVSKMKVLVIGNGGASKAIQCVLSDLNAKEINILLNNKQSLDEVYAKHLDTDLIINTSPVGMSPNVLDSPIDITLFKNVEVVIDIVYNPLKTQLLIDSEANNIKIINGIEMLVVQAIKSLEIFKEMKFTRNEYIETINNTIRLHQNIVLIGMPGSGKTSISKKLGEELDMEVFDLDYLIEEKINDNINDFVKINGIEKFREIESKITNKISLNKGCIISCGGGIILNESNINNLKRNGLLIYIDRNYDKIKINNNRPLVNSKEDLLDLYNKRKDLYLKYADITVKNNGRKKDCIKHIINKLGY